jgi:CDP-paratose 2-epimerase
MKVLITGACGFVGSQIAIHLASQAAATYRVTGIDNLSRAGSELNRTKLRENNVAFIHGDMRSQSDIDSLGEFDWVIDCAALPSVLAGTAGNSSSRQLVEHNLVGTINLLELCRRTSAGLVLISTSRVYSIPPLASLPLFEHDEAFGLDTSKRLPSGCSIEGINESFSTQAPVSLYGATKVASENLALEYAAAFDFPIWINRCGVLAGAGQFARPDQGIFSYWLHAYAAKQPLRYIGFGGSGKQVRDALHPKDLARLLEMQLQNRDDKSKPKVINVSGGLKSARSLKQLSAWCADRFERMEVTADLTPRPFDLPWIVLDSSLANQHWHWKPLISTDQILEEIADHTTQHPDWLKATR